MPVSEHPAAKQLYDAEASRAIDAQAIAHLGVTGFVLMQRAADAAFAALLQHFPGVSSICVWCGKGNNAGDAYLVAAKAHQFGIRTEIVALVDPATLTGDAATAAAEARAAQVPIAIGLPAHSPEADVFVDGLLGTGLSGAPRAPFGEGIGLINAAARPVLAIDIPSGVNADTGAVHTEAVRAALTVSFITRKLGMYTGAGVSHAGQRVFDDLGVPADMYIAPGVPRLRWLPHQLSVPDANTYKHRQGHVIVAGGDQNMPGAVALAAAAALRVGAGMVTAVTRAEHRSALVSRTPEVMVQGFAGPQAATSDDAQLDELLTRADLVVLGPGLGRTRWGEALFSAVEQSGKPVVLDADGLFWLSRRSAWQGGDLTVTPHVAEAARLLEMTAAEVQQDRPAACRLLRQRFNCRGVLKGAGSVVFSSRNEQLGICAHGNPGMATAGMGDVLSGVVGGLLAPQAASAEQCDARLASAVALHSAAADHAAHDLGQLSLLAGDVIGALPALLKSISGGPSLE